MTPRNCLAVASLSLAFAFGLAGCGDGPDMNVGGAGGTGGARPDGGRRPDGGAGGMPDAGMPAQLRGTVLSIDGDPLPGVGIGLGSAMGSAIAPAADFAVSGIAPGTSVIDVDGQGFVGAERYSKIVEQLHGALGPNEQRTLVRPIYLTPLQPPLDLSGAIEMMGPSFESSVESSSTPGLRIDIPAGQGVVSIPSGPGSEPGFSLTGIPFDRTPFALDGYGASVVGVFEPSGLEVSMPMPVSFPNAGGIPLGTRLEIWSVDHVHGGLSRIGNEDRGDAEVVPLRGKSGGKNLLGGAQIPGDTEIKTDPGKGIRGFSLKIPVCRRTSVTGRAVDAAGLPLPDVSVVVKAPASADAATSAKSWSTVPGGAVMTGADGRFEIPDLFACQLRVEGILQRGGMTFAGRTGELGTQGPADTDVGDLRIDTETPLVAVDVLVRAISSLGTPIRGVPVAVEPCFGDCSARTASSGEARLPGVLLPPGDEITAQGVGACLPPARGVAPSQPGQMLLLEFHDSRPTSPSISALKPFAAKAGGGAQPIVVLGAGLFPSSRIHFGGATLEARLVTCDALFAAIPASSLATPGNVEVRVENPSGGTSAAARFEILPDLPAAATVASVEPDHGAPGQHVLLVGTGFGATQGASTVTFPGAVATNVVRWTDTAVEVVVPPGAQTGLLQVTTAGGIAESPGPFHLEGNPTPVLSSLSPSQLAAGSAQTTVQATGTGFVPDTRCAVNGMMVTTRVLSGTSLELDVPQALLVAPGTLSVTATNPVPGGGTSTPASITVVQPNPRPVLTRLSPSSVMVGSPDLALTIDGSGFSASSMVQFGSAALPATLRSNTQLQVTVPAAQLATQGPKMVTVTNPMPGGGASNALTFSVGPPLPEIVSLSPASVPAGSAQVALTVTGRNFAQGATVRFGGVDLGGTFVSATQLQATIPATSLQTVAVLDVVVRQPGVGDSAPAPFTIGEPTPVVGSLQPSQIQVESPAFTLTVRGAGFVAAATVRAGATALQTTFVSATELQAQVPATLVATAGTLDITVANSAMNVSTPAVPLQVILPTPLISSLAPSSTATGSGTLQLIVNGSGFLTSSVVRWAGTPLATVFVNSTQLGATVPASLLVNAGFFDVTVANGASISAASPFNVQTPSPAISNLSPSQVTVGGGTFTLTVSGTGFLQGTSVVIVGGTSLPSTFISGGQLSVSVPASMIATAGTLSVVVSNGGLSSPAASLTVQNPAPVVTTLAPATANVGGAGFNLTITGSSFLAGAVVDFGATTGVTPTSQTATQLVVPVTTAMLGNVVGPLTVSVRNPSPAAGSGSASFTVAATAPTLTSIAPTSAPVGGAAFTLTANGGPFHTTSAVVWNGTPLATTFVSQAQVTAQVTAAQLATAGNAPVLVRNGAGLDSAAQTFAVQNPQATVTGFAPASSNVGAAAFTLSINGTGFVAGAVVDFGASTGLVPTTVTATQLQVPVTTAMLGTLPGNVSVTVRNPAPNGGNGTGSFPVNPGTPTLTSISPTTAVTGAAAFTLTASGTLFYSSSSIVFDGTPLTTTFVSATQLTASVPAAQVATARSLVVSVSNGAFGSSGTQAFTVQNPQPVVSSLSPSSNNVGAPDFTLSINGTGFVAGALVDFGAATGLVPTSITATQLQVAITTAMLGNSTGPIAITIRNPAPNAGNGTTSFNVTAGAPVLTSIAPANVLVGAGAFTLTANGSGYTTGSQIVWGGTPLTTTFVTQNQLTAGITAAQVAAAGNVTVLVRNGAGNDSGGQTFAVQNPQPTIATYSPASSNVGAAAFSLTINGTNFVSGVVVDFGGSTGVVPTTQTATQLVVPITTAMLGATPSTLTVTVRNPAPSAGNATGSYTVNPGTPTLTSIAPVSAAAGGGAFTLTANGTRFYSGSSVVFDGTSYAATGNDTQITASIPAAQLATARTVNVTVSNGAFGSSGARTFDVQNPATTVTALTPSSASVGASNFTITVDGTGFVSGAVVDLGSTALATTFVSSTRLTATVTTAAIGVVPGTPNITVRNPAPSAGNGTRAFTVNPGTPILTSISPNHIGVNSGATTITLTGSRFYSGTQVSFGAFGITPTVTNDTTMTAVVPAAQLTTARNVSVTVNNQTWGTSGAQTFAVENPAPTITSLSPASSSIVTQGFTLTINGTFVNPATVTFGGQAMTISSQSPTQIVASVDPAMVPDTGAIVVVTVTNPAPAAGAGSSSFTWYNAVPIITSLSPSRLAAAAGGDVTVTLDGSYFTRNSTVTVDGTTNLATTFVNATQLTALLPRSARISMQQLTVTNPQVSGLGGGTSGPAYFAWTGWDNRTQTAGGRVPPALVAPVVVNAFGYVNVLFGYITNSPALTLSETMYRYNIATATWDNPITLAGYGRWKSGYAFDEANQRIVVFGGETNVGGTSTATDQLLMIDSAGNVTVSTGNGPAAVSEPAFAYDAARKRSMYVTGGASTWFWNGVRWSGAYTPYSPSNTGMRLTCDSNAADCTAFGGSNGSTFVGTSYIYSNAGASFDWQAATLTPTPTGRQLGAYLTDPGPGTQLYHGGYTTTTTVVGELWDRLSGGWQQETTLTGGPAVRAWHGGTFASGDYGGVFAIFGGINLGGRTPTWTNELWLLEPDADWRCPVLRTSGQSQRITLNFSAVDLFNPQTGMVQWVNSGVTLSACHRYTIRVLNPTQTFATCERGSTLAGADGIPTNEPDCPVSMSRNGALVGMVFNGTPTGTGSNQFEPGVGPTTRINRNFGTLYLSIDWNAGGGTIPTGGYNVQIDY